MAGESVNENIYLAITFGYGGQKKFQKPPLVIAERCGQLLKNMTTLEKVRTFLKNNSEISYGYNVITFLPADKLDEGQVGYSVDSKNNSLITGQEGDWKEEWLVIGTDSLIGDPIFIDTSSNKLQVLTAAHGEGEWESIPIADSLDSFANIISELKKISVNRTSPMDLEKNPMTEKERKQFLLKVEKDNSEIEIDYWENFLEDE